MKRKKKEIIKLALFFVSIYIFWWVGEEKVRERRRYVCLLFPFRSILRTSLCSLLLLFHWRNINEIQPKLKFRFPTEIALTHHHTILSGADLAFGLIRTKKKSCILICHRGSNSPVSTINVFIFDLKREKCDNIKLKKRRYTHSSSFIVTCLSLSLFLSDAMTYAVAWHHHCALAVDWKLVSFPHRHNSLTLMYILIAKKWNVFILCWATESKVVDTG